MKPKLTEINSLAASFVLLNNGDTNSNYYSYNYYCISNSNIGRRTVH